MTDDDTIRQLQEALRLSPDNLPLRRMLAERLLALGLHTEAEVEFRAAQRSDPTDLPSALGLARTFVATGRNPAALVVIEEVCGRPDAPASAHLLHARVLLRAGDRAAAAHAYRRAVSGDATLSDAELATACGADLSPAPSHSPDHDQRLRAGPDTGSDGASWQAPERPTLRFADVGGMEALKESIRLKIIYPVTRPEIYRAYGKKTGGGIMLYGPPGCGKTHLARAVAGELGAHFLAIGINDVLEMWIGASEKNLHALFENARGHKPCVLFIDEVDALAASRSDMRASAGRQVINQFLAELDGIGADNEGLLILAATNAPWHVDAAFRRPGRFDQVIFVPPPDQSARAAILRLHLVGKPATEVDHDQVAKRTEGFSGADLKAVVDHAVEGKLADALKSGTPLPITTKDLLAAAKARRSTCQEWFASARNHALYANQGGMYDEVLAHLNIRKP